MIDPEQWRRFADIARIQESALSVADWIPSLSLPAPGFTATEIAMKIRAASVQLSRVEFEVGESMNKVLDRLVREHLFHLSGWDVRRTSRGGVWVRRRW